MHCGILNQTEVTNSLNAYGQLFWFSGKCVFVQKVLKRIVVQLHLTCRSLPVTVGGALHPVVSVDQQSWY